MSIGMLGKHIIATKLTHYWRHWETYCCNKTTICKHKLNGLIRGRNGYQDRLCKHKLNIGAREFSILANVA